MSEFTKGNIINKLIRLAPLIILFISVLNEIDLKHIVLETDSPYLAPKPFRGKRNESAYITNVLDKLADIYSVSAETIADLTTENSKAIFNI